MATREQPTTASTESAQDPAARNPSYREPPGRSPEIISNTLVRVDRKIGRRLTAEQHHALIQLTAYYLAERRGFEPGREIEDWSTAEKLVIETSGLPVT